MVKKGLYLLLFSLLLSLFLSSCEISPTYSRNEIEDVIEEICKKEFNINVKTFIAGETVWIYAPMDKLLDEDNQIDKSVVANTRKIYLSLLRVMLSMDKPPEFYAFVVSDIKDKGADFYQVGYVPDFINFQMHLISYSDFADRQVSRHIPNPHALGDKEGIHIQKYNITMGDFLAYLVRQKMQNMLIAEDVKDYFKMNMLRAYYHNGKLGVGFKVVTVKEKQGLPSVFEIAEKSIKQVLQSYESFKDVLEIEITDEFTQKRRFYTRKAFLQEMAE